MTSSIYNGTVIHKRFKPKTHFFKYKVFSFLLDLSELEYLSKKIKFFSYNKFNLVSFYEKDHGNRDGSSLISWVKKNLLYCGSYFGYGFHEDGIKSSIEMLKNF